jgi:hypothetical protein
MTRRAYVAVEGPHDAAVVAALLRPAGFHRVQKAGYLDPFWQRLVPKTFPHRDDLLARVPVPLFLTGPECSVAVHSASGDGGLYHNIEETLALVDREQISVGAILDADSQKPAVDRFTELAKQLRSLNLPVPTAAGDVAADPRRCGIFVLPDNTSSGTLETILVGCAQSVYPELLASAQAFVDTIDPSRYSPDEMKDFTKPAGKSKAIVASVASILRPGKAIQVSLQDNRWMRDQALALPSVIAVQTFLAKLVAQ